MDFPLFHMDFLNNRFLIAVIAIVHVLINHPMAVGGIPLVTLLEWKGYRCTSPEDSAKWDRLAYRILFFFFLVTTTVGAMTGVGIWFSASLVNPAAIGSLIRVFFWAWFSEWVVFVTEVAMILFYFLTWKKLSKTNKKKHIWIGVGLSIASWLTMAIITSILGFMMDPGNWMTDRSFLQGVLNPLYLPQLALRSPLAMVMGGAAGLLLTPFFVGKDRDFRLKATKAISTWILYWIPFTVLGAMSYWHMVPDVMMGNLPVANTTQTFSDWYNALLYIILAACGTVTLVALWGWRGKYRTPALVSAIPFLLLLLLLAHFERVREFIRKPYAIGEYLYSNGIRVEDYPLFRKDGLLKHATYATVREITPENRVRAGKEVFMLACTRCHTVNGVNSIAGNLRGMYGDAEWDPNLVAQYVDIMHHTRGYMPPFPGNDAEREALAHYLVFLQKNGDTLPGAQNDGARLSHDRGRLP
ncbi:Cytochrome c [Sulfidibacter corallicola]|uniref:Cytochrome c n=1 Tax=Sulfidibacter corallicola TaxID=2818388 RepID=A0A8A4TQ05_SULCO|nr:cytochrome c [Sulfidibacter corallicola]QTD52049.1 cytochrome c [Sulfidibacter corallicola]